MLSVEIQAISIAYPAFILHFMLRDIKIGASILSSFSSYDMSSCSYSEEAYLSLTELNNSLQSKCLSELTSVFFSLSASPSFKLESDSFLVIPESYLPEL